MSLSSLRRPLALAAAAALLSGCGATSPGVAVSVGEQTVSVAEVDEAADAVCRSVERELRSGNQVVPLGQMRQYTLSLLAAAAQARQIADEYDVEPGADFRRARAQVAAQAEATLPEHLQEPYIEAMSAEALVSSVISAAGEAALSAEGVEDPSTEQVSQRGSDIFATWPDAHGVDVDPRYGLELVDGQLRLADTSLSTAVSDPARAAAAEQPDPAYARSLPGSQRCG